MWVRTLTPCSSLGGVEPRCARGPWRLPSGRPVHSVDSQNVHFHDLRHFGLTMAAAAGATTKELMRQAGHSSPAAALRYQHATENRDKAIVDALTELGRGAKVVPMGHGKTRASRTGRGRRRASRKVQGL